MSTPAYCALLFVAYVALTVFASRRSAAGSGGGSFAAFAAGKAELSSLATALVLTACHVSTATFAINPGYVYKDGLAALIGFTVPVTVGITAALALLGPGFRATSVGPDGEPRALTMPQWLGARFESEGLRRFFSLLVLALFGYLVMVVVGAAYVVAGMADLPVWAAAAFVVALVLSGTATGGAGKQAQANAARGAILFFASVILLGGAAVSLLGNGGAALDRLRAEDPGLFHLVRQGSPIFGDVGSAYLYPLAIGFALGCQPNILGKVLFLRDRKAVVGASLASGVLFLVISFGALIVGLAARADLGPGLAQDQVASLWVARTFSPPLAALVAVALIAGAVSTLDGLFLALGTTVAHDLVRPLLPAAGGPEADRRALRIGRISTLAIGALALAVSVDPPKLVWVTGSLGAYALVAAACPAVIGGLFERRASARWVAAAAVLGPALHVGLYASGVTKNPNATGTAGLLLAGAVVGLGTILAHRSAEAFAATPTAEGNAPLPAEIPLQPEAVRV